MAAPVAYLHPSSHDHDTGAHPERAARMTAIAEALDAAGWLGYERRESPAAPRTALEAIHPPAHVDAIERLCLTGGGMIDADTVVSPGSWVAALHAAGGAVALVDSLLGEGVAVGASLHRPPGHHAEAARAMGFCLFNNVAVAARHALDAHGARRVMIVDWDVHHGNGTNDIFHEDPSVLFCSIHQSPLYPGSGAADDVGAGAGTGFTVNLPVPAGSGDAVFGSLLGDVIAPIGRSFGPDLVLVSAGFDAHSDDPLAGCSMTDDGFGALASCVRALADDVGAPLGIVLEGGYALGALGRSVVATLGGALTAACPPADGRHPLADAARVRLSSSWPLDE